MKGRLKLELLVHNIVAAGKNDISQQKLTLCTRTRDAACSHMAGLRHSALCLMQLPCLVPFPSNVLLARYGAPGDRQCAAVGVLEAVRDVEDVLGGLADNVIIMPAGNRTGKASWVLGGGGGGVAATTAAAAASNSERPGGTQAAITCSHSLPNGGMPTAENRALEMYATSRRFEHPGAEGVTVASVHSITGLLLPVL